MEQNVILNNNAERTKLVSYFINYTNTSFTYCSFPKQMVIFTWKGWKMLNTNVWRVALNYFTTVYHKLWHLHENFSHLLKKYIQLLNYFLVEYWKCQLMIMRQLMAVKLTPSAKPVSKNYLYLVAYTDQINLLNFIWNMNKE